MKNDNIGTDSDQVLLLDFQATLEPKPEKAIKLEKDALALITEIISTGWLLSWATAINFSTKLT